MKRGYLQNSGMIIIASLLMLSLMLLLTQQLLQNVYVGNNFIKTMINRERAEMVALGGINLAIAQLQGDGASDKKDPQEKQKKEEKEKQSITQKKQSPVQQFVARVVPYLNRWQEFELKQDVDGVDGLLKICISSEDGKININEAFDFKKEDFDPNYGNLLKALEIRGKVPAGEIYNRIVEFFKKRKKKLNDISELYAVEGLNNIDIFYHPPKTPQGKKEKPQPNHAIALLDLFTIWTGRKTIETRMFSDSLCAIFGLRRPVAGDHEAMKEKFDQFVNAFQPKLNDFGSLEAIYGGNVKYLKQRAAIFSKQFGPTAYSVLSSGKVENVEQTVLAIIKKVERPKKVKTKEVPLKEQKTGKQSGKRTPHVDQFKIVRVYWL